MSLSFNGLGNEGRLGNQMFQYASLRGIAANRGFDWIIPPSDVFRYDNYGLFDCFELKNCTEQNIGESGHKTEEHRVMHFLEDFYNTISDNTNLSGMFQTEKYFENVSDSIREDFTFKSAYLDPCKDFISSIEGDPIFLHVRRGNPNITGRRGEKWSYQMVQEYHPLCKKEYYFEALKQFPEDVPVIVVSDLIDWCKKQEWLQGDRFYFSDSSYETFGDGASVPYVDLCLMSLCKGGIIANSSLSWWGAWLQNDVNKIIAPDPWFGPAYSHYNMSDLIPSRWIKIDNDPSFVEPEE